MVTIVKNKYKNKYRSEKSRLSQEYYNEITEYLDDMAKEARYKIYMLDVVLDSKVKPCQLWYYDTVIGLVYINSICNVIYDISIADSYKKLFRELDLNQFKGCTIEMPKEEM